MPALAEFHALLVIGLAVGLDALLGEPRRYHPLVYFGRLASWMESRLLGNASRRAALPPERQRYLGMLAMLLVLLPFVGPAIPLAQLPDPAGLLLEAGMLYLALGNKSLKQHAWQVYQALHEQDLALARQRVALLVSRDTGNMQNRQVTRATIESVLENGNDAVFGAILWYLIAGLPGVLLYRLVNTLDAMWGYKTERFVHFGWAAARLDDVLNWLPARLSALTYILLGDKRLALHSWRTQAPHWESPNAGAVMAAGAGALGITLGGEALYHGRLKQRPVLGAGRAPDSHDIKRSTALIQRGLLLWLSCILLGSWALAAA